MSLPVILIHGWSVKNTNTYGALPKSLEKEATAQGLDIDIHNIWLGKYVSFHDEVMVWDISLALEKALIDALGKDFRKRRFACITHSTGGPVVRDWWQRYNLDKSRPCPMSHLIMLAPANFGSALAQLGKSTLSRIKFFFDGGVEPGVGVLNWLELGSRDAYTLNRQWVEQVLPWQQKRPVFPFVLTGQCIDHKFYDHVNSYTGELGSDGVVRAAAANLNCSYLKLIQENVETERIMLRGKKQKVYYGQLKPEAYQKNEGSAFRLVEDRAHSNKKMGIMRSVGLANPDYSLIEIVRCLKVKKKVQYEKLVQAFDLENRQIEKDEIFDVDKKFLLKDNVRIRDQYCMVVIRVRDEHQRPINNYDLLFTGPGSDPNMLPAGFIADCQRNQLSKNTVTYFLNHTLLKGCPELKRGNTIVRLAADGIQELGIRIVPHQLDGFAHYAVAEFTASKEMATSYLKPHQTMMVDVVLKRIVHENTTRLTKKTRAEDFSKVKPGDVIL